MSYLRFRQEPALGYVGCGSGCACAPCRKKESAGFVGEAAAPAPAVAPAFRIQCPAPIGCAPAAVAQCRNVLYQAVREAIKLADGAAKKLEDRTPEAVRLFNFFFAHNPAHPIPWAGNEESAISVVKRLRAVAKALQKGGRNTLFRCLVTTPGCPDTDLTCCDSNTNAWITTPNTVNLCAQFWNPPAGLRGLPAAYFRAGVIIHEMLHLLYNEFLLHGPRRANAHCYEAFALRVAGFGANPSDVCACRGTC